MPAAGTTLSSGTKTLLVIFTPSNSTVYNTVSKTVALVVDKKSLTVKADDKTRVQGIANPAFTFTYKGFVGSDTASTIIDTPPTFNTLATVSSVVGTYLITKATEATFGSTQPNYSFVYESGTLTVTAVSDAEVPSTPLHPSVTAQSTSQITFTWDAANDNVGVTKYNIYRCSSIPTSSCSLSSPAFATVNAPTTTYVDTGLTASTRYRYAVSASDAAGNESAMSSQVTTLTNSIAKIDPTISWTQPSAITYGTALSGTQLNASANVAGSFEYTPAIGTILSAGDTVLLATFTPADSAKYSTVSKTLVLTVNKKNVTVTADNLSKEIGYDNPVLTASYSVLVNGDTTAQFDELASLTTTATKNSAVNTYPIIPSGAVSSNYSFSYVNGVLTVTKDMTGPTQPGLPALTVISQTEIKISWGASTDLSSGTAGYEVFRCGTAGSATLCTPTDLIKTLGNVTSYNDTGLTAGTYYRYRVRAYDRLGNRGNYSSSVSATTLASTLTATLTAEPAGGDSLPFSNLLKATRSGNATGAITYEYKCGTPQAEDKDKKNEAWKSGTIDPFFCLYSALGTYTGQVRITQGGQTATAETTIVVAKDNTPPTLTTVAAGSVTSSSATITWKTNESATSQVEYGLTIAYGNKTPTALAQNSKGASQTAAAYGSFTILDPLYVLTHSQTLINLLQKTLYHYRVISIDALGNKSVSPDQTFTTGAPTPPTSGYLSGWAWSSTIGWISMNSDNARSNGGNYRVRLDTTTGTLIGYAWSSNIGWIEFGVSESGKPAASVILDPSDPLFGQITGWVRATAGAGRTDGWDGWIELSGDKHTSPDTNATANTKGLSFYTITAKESGVDVTRGYFRGFGWGSEVVGWVNFCLISNCTNNAVSPNLDDRTVTITQITGGDDFNFTLGAPITVDFRTTPSYTTTPGTVTVSRSGSFRGKVTLSTSAADSKLPKGASINPLSPAECDLAVNENCTINVSINNSIPPAESNKSVHVNAVGGTASKPVTVPINMYDTSCPGCSTDGDEGEGIKMWLKNPADLGDESRTTMTLRAGQAAHIQWRAEVGTNRGPCVGTFKKNGTLYALPNFTTESEYNPPNLQAGSYVFTMKCRDADGGPDFIAANGIKTSLDIKVVSPKIEEK